jgi:hypothetical protein
VVVERRFLEFFFHLAPRNRGAAFGTAPGELLWQSRR